MRERERRCFSDVVPASFRWLNDMRMVVRFKEKSENIFGSQPLGKRLWRNNDWLRDIVPPIPFFKHDSIYQRVWLMPASQWINRISGAGSVSMKSHAWLAILGEKSSACSQPSTGLTKSGKLSLSTPKSLSLFGKTTVWVGDVMMEMIANGDDGEESVSRAICSMASTGRILICAFLGIIVNPKENSWNRIPCFWHIRFPVHSASILAMY